MSSPGAARVGDPALIRAGRGLLVRVDAVRDGMAHLCVGAAEVGLCGEGVIGAPRSPFWWGVLTAEVDRFCLLCNAEAAAAVGASLAPDGPRRLGAR
jgi:hypothetical protein